MTREQSHVFALPSAADVKYCNQARNIEDICCSSIHCHNRKVFNRVVLFCVCFEARFSVATKRHRDVRSTLRTRFSQVCFDVVGCFDQKGLLAHARQFPQSPKEIGTAFRLYSRSGSDVLDIYAPGGMTLPRAYRTGGPLKVITHGLGGNGNVTYLRHMMDALLRLEDGNVVVVDWWRGSRLLDYVQACVNSELVGREVAHLVASLVRNGVVQPWNVHLIGFSLGAQTMGFAARRLARNYGLKAGRLTALDGAAPLFETHGLHPRKQDVLYLDAVHTSAGTNLLMGHVGLRRPFGHVDFYPNGGVHQKGCEQSLTCSHQRASLYFVESLRHWTQCRFKSLAWPEGCRFFNSRRRCGRGPPSGSDFGRMGYFSPSTKARGVHYLETNQDQPFCKE
ncbi:pancreatic triacylglycerol lipase-like isoform X1 [Ixodes scapularis]|uniref:pancreatic triacylglycerol lipase-like isoform X1 n=1 Tax=Ixodes scapularis TaxID=6945 RepID=UPI001C38C594|nr:pancreatic triacylglycerol lipase-like isoform X1 [Ixodes scapularis]